MIHARGAGSSIAVELNKLHPVRPVWRADPIPLDGDRYLFCQGIIQQKRPVDQTSVEMLHTFWVNCARTIQECDRILDVNPKARICVVGSESAFKGSFDGIYAAAKAGIHRYVETKRLKYSGQQLVCVAPTCILGTGMNEQRNEDGKAALEARRIKHPKQRWLEPIEVATLIHFLLFVDEGYITNVVIRVNGGEHTRLGGVNCV